MKSPYISVILPTLNEERYIEKTLKSLKNQTFKDFEIIISDGSSEDKTIEIAKKYTPNIIITKHNTVTFARQKGAEKAQGKIIVGADADTFYPPKHLEYIVEDFKNPEIVAVGGGALFPKKPIWVYLGWKTVYGINNILSSLNIAGYIPAFNLAFRKSAFQKIGGYNTYIDYGGDERDITKRLKKVGKIYYDRRLKPISSNRRSKVGFFSFIIKEGLIDYYISYALAKIFKRTIIRGKPIR